MCHTAEVLTRYKIRYQIQKSGFHSSGKRHTMTNNSLVSRQRLAQFVCEILVHLFVMTITHIIIRLRRIRISKVLSPRCLLGAD